MTREELRQALSFYRDLGVTDLYRSGAGFSLGAPSGPGLQPPSAGGDESALLCRDAESPPPSRDRKGAIEGTESLIPLAPSGDTLDQIQRDIGPDCRRCRLCEQRSKIVFGVGNPQARLVFV